MTDLMKTLLAEHEGARLDLKNAHRMRDQAEIEVGEAFLASLQRGRLVVQLAKAEKVFEIGVPITIGYTNWRGEHAVRTIMPKKFFVDSTEWHPELQVLLKAIDMDRDVERDFAVKDFDYGV